MIPERSRCTPNFQAVATTLRNAKTASVNDWGAILWTGGEFYRSPRYARTSRSTDRVGRRRPASLRPGLRFLAGRRPQQAVEYGRAHGAMAHGPRPGDTSMATPRK